MLGISGNTEFAFTFTLPAFLTLKAAPYGLGSLEIS
jgi:hypothetical protein